MLFNLLTTNSKFPAEVAVELLRCFFIIHGPVEHDKGKACLIPYFSSTFMDDSWETDGPLQLRMDIIVDGLSLPWYVYQLTTVSVLKQELCSLRSMKIARNGATVHYGKVSTHLVHDYNTRKITLQVSTTIELLSKSWKRLHKAGKDILSLLSSTWKACHPEVLIYCAHCLFRRDPKPDHYVNPYWFDPDNLQEKPIMRDATSFGGVEPETCMRCLTNEKISKPSVPRPLRRPCKLLPGLYIFGNLYAK